MSMLRRFAGRLLSRPGRYSTGFADLPAIDNAREVLISLYKRQIEVCSGYSGEKQFNASVIGQARHHLSILEQYPNDWDVEYEINMGPLEKLITFAEDQLELIDVMNNEFKPTENFNKEDALAAARQSSDPFFGQDDRMRTLVLHPVPAGVPSVSELGPFPSLPYSGWPYVPPPKGWKYGAGHSRENWEAGVRDWVESLNVPRQKLVSKFMAENSADERKAIAAAVAEAAKLALADYHYTDDKKPEGYDAAVQHAKDSALSLEHDRAIYMNTIYDRTVAAMAAEPQPVDELSAEEQALLQTEVGAAAVKIVESLEIPAPTQPIKF